LPVIVRTAQGSLRDALSLLDTAIAYGNGRLDAELTAALLGSTAPARIREFAAALIDHDPATALEAIDRAAREGEDLGAFARDVIELLRLALVLTAAPGARLPELTSVESNELRKLGESVSLDEILYVLRAFLDADEMMRESPHPRVELEIATVRATRRPVPQALEEVLRRVDEAEARLRQQALAPGPRGQAQDSLLPLPEEAPSRSPASGGGAPGTRLEAGARRSGGTATALADPRPGGAQRAVAAVDPPPRVAGAAPEASASADLATAWQRVVDDVMKKKPMLSAVLAQARPRGVSAGVLSLSVTGNHFHREMLSDLAARDLITQAVRRWVADADRFEVVAAEEVSGGPTAHPGVQAVIAEFEGEVVAVRARTPEGEGQ
jgi:DNA polymerase-3 subunit gamma/tau